MPEKLTNQVLAYAAIELRPRATLIKFYLLALTGAGVTLLICPQFGVGPWGGGHGIIHWVMKYGPAVCGAFCGMVYMGTGTLLATLFLDAAQGRWVERQQIWLTLPVVALSFVVLMAVNYWGELNSLHAGFNFNLAWNAAAVVSSWCILKSVLLVRRVVWAV